MTSNERKYYILGLEDAIAQLRTEINCCEGELSDEALITAKYSLRNGISLILSLIEGVENNL